MSELDTLGQVASANRPNTSKETNPKDGIGERKASLTNLSFPVMFETSIALGEGAFKYRRHNYRVYGVRASVYVSGAMRHLGDWWEGEDIDPGSQLSHITKAIAGLTVLRDAMIFNLWTDDRPPKAPKGWMDEMNALQVRMLERMEATHDFPHKPPHTQVEEDQLRRAQDHIDPKTIRATPRRPPRSESEAGLDAFLSGSED